MAKIWDSSAHYDANISAMQNIEGFYNWLTTSIMHHVPAYDAQICDMGCGTGALVARRQDVGYIYLSGVDFAQGCVDQAQKAVQARWIGRHDIVMSPLPQKYDLILMTSILDFVQQLVVALQHARQSLQPNGLLMVTMRNRWAYWPFYHLRSAARLLNRMPRLQHWFLWFSTPLGMRRNDQPYERVASLREARALLKSAQLIPIAEHGMMIFPMLSIPEVTVLWDR
ncbi:MAG: hypothetical protein NVS2B7_03040 [Herpetosiphon sp.]